MKREALVLALLLPALAPAQAPAPALPAAAAQAEARRAEELAAVRDLAARLHERVACVLLPVNARGLPAFKADSRGSLLVDATVQVDLAAYRAWAGEFSRHLRRLAADVEPVRLLKEPAGYRFEAPDREFDASQFVVVDDFSEIPRALGARVYTFDVATASEIRAAFRQPRDRKAQTCVLVQFRGPEGPVASVRAPFSLGASPESVAPFVSWHVRYQRFGAGAKGVKFPVLSFRSRRTVRLQVPKADTSALRTMKWVWTACLPGAAADAAAASKTGEDVPFRDVRGRVLRPRRAAAPAAADAAETPAAGTAASAEAEARRRSAEARALRLRADAATAAAVRASADGFFAAVRGGARGKAAADAIGAFEPEDLSVACVEALQEHPGAPDLLVSGEAYLASQLWAKWRMRARLDGDAVVPAEPTWSLAPSFQPPEYIRGASRINPFPELSLDDPGSDPEPAAPPADDSVGTGPVLLALAAVALFAGTVALLWIERLRRKADEAAPGA